MKYRPGDIVKTTGILTGDLEIYCIKKISANGGYWCSFLTDPEVEKEGINSGTIDKRGILLFEKSLEKIEL